MKGRNSGNDSGERRKCMEQKFSQLQIQERSPNQFDILDSLLLEYLEKSKEEKQSQVAENSKFIPSSSLSATGEQEKVDVRVNTRLPEELNSEEEKTKSSGNNLTQNTSSSGIILPESSSLLLSQNPVQPSRTSTAVPEDQTREDEAKLKKMKKSPKGKKRPRKSEFQDMDVNISKKIAFLNSQDKDISEKENDKDSGGMSKSIQDNYGQSENQENGKTCHTNNHSLKPIRTLDPILMAYHEGSKEKSQVAESMAMSPFWNPLLPTNKSTLMKLPEEQTKEQRTQPQIKEKEAMDKPADGTPILDPNNSSPLKEIFQNLGGSEKFDALMRGEFQLEINETDFLPDPPVLNGLTNKSEKQNAENIKASDDSNGMKVRHKFSTYQLQFLHEYFHRNEYLRPDEVQMLSNKLNLTPQQILCWFRNQRSKKNKCADSLKEGFYMHAANEIPTRSMNISPSWKETFPNLEGVDGVRKQNRILNPEEKGGSSYFLPQTPALTRFQKKDEENKSENAEGSVNQERRKKHKLLGYQLQTLNEYFHKNEYIKPNEVKVLSNMLNLTPQQIKFWFGNQRAKKRKRPVLFNGV